MKTGNKDYYNEYFLLIDISSSWLEFAQNVIKNSGYKVFVYSNPDHIHGQLIKQKLSSIHVIVDSRVIEQNPLMFKKRISTVYPKSTFTVVYEHPLAKDIISFCLKSGLSNFYKKPYGSMSLIGLVKHIIAENQFSHEAPLQPASRSGSILLVEDNKWWHDILIQSIKQSDALQFTKTITALNFAEAWKYIETQNFDLIVADLSLNGEVDLEGIELLSALREKEKKERSGKKTPIIIVSAQFFPESVKNAYSDISVYFFLEKRLFTPQVFIKLILDVLNT